MANLLEVEGLTVSIPVGNTTLRPVRGVDLTLARGETLAIVGESGCGKSLTSLAILGLLPPRARIDARKLEFAGQSLLGLKEAELRKLRGSRIAMIFQDPMTALDPYYRIGNQLTRVINLHRPMQADAARDAVVAMLSRVGIASPEARLRQYPYQLSGGLRQRVMLAMALLCEPDIILADEPTTALDVTIQTQILALLADIQKERGLGLILVTHDMGVVAGVAHRVAVMYGGQVVEVGPSDDIIGGPHHPYTAGLMRSIPVPGTTGRRQPLGFIPGVVPRPVGILESCAFHDRCAYAEHGCTTAAVPMRPLGGHRAARCIKPLRQSGDGLLGNAAALNGKVP